MKLTSIDYARLIQYAAQKQHMVLLNKTQINKILFYVYGVYLAMEGKPLFDDDTPKAWTYGPVCKELIVLHRVVENTRARRRLEKWSLRVIALYLFIVLFIVMLCYVKLPIIDGLISINIPDAIMITILSTTTVNIIGLGLIVLRGHFLDGDKSNNMENDKEKK